MSSIEDKPLWRSLAELEGSAPDSPDLPHPAAGLEEDLADPLTRRRFMQLMGASAALAGAVSAGCRRWEKEEIVPLDQRPDGYVPGVPKHFATAMELSGVATGLLVTSYDGRPIKVEGNPDHPFTGGASTALAQASILSLYDPDRSRAPVRRQSGNKLPATWEDFAALAKKLTVRASESKIRVLSEASSSPTLERLRGLLARRYPNLVWHEYEPIGRESERIATNQVFGSLRRPVPALDKAKTIVALDADLFSDHPAALHNARGFAAGRRPEVGAMGRLYAVESTLSSTGAVADHRLPLRSELVLPFLMSVEAKLEGKPGPDAAFLGDEKVARFRDAIAKDLAGAREQGVICVGHRQPPEVHMLAARLNAPAVGHALDYVFDPAGNPLARADGIAELVAAMNTGAVDTLLILGGNPVYDAPVDLELAKALSLVPTTIHLSEYDDETSAQCAWHLPRAHYLESWGDARAWDGTYGVLQPLIAPLHGGRSAIEIVALLLGRDVKSGEELVRETFPEVTGTPKGDDAAWRKALHDGFVPNTSPQKVSSRVGNVPEPELPERLSKYGAELPNGELEVVFTSSPHSYDGRFANNAWLQEIPDFATKLTWENAALIGPSTAESLGVENNTEIEITVGGRTLRIPAYVMPGQAPGSIALALGHGRTRAGRVGGLTAEGVAPTGFDTYALRTSAAPFIATGASVRATGKHYRLANTQDHFQIDARGQRAVEKRAPMLVRRGSLDDYQAFVHEHEGADPEHMPEFGSSAHHPALFSLFSPPVEYTGYKWGMTIDLSHCTGCSACVVACQAENNIPVVGRDGVLRNREMQWLRVDRYFAGDPDDPEVYYQPVPCQQCENAPCEQVCPVGATLHSDEGLNDMAYNRCVGTRYCMNNCAYKVRRFNFFNYNKDLENPRNQIRRLLFNPEVTLRSRGVMEKCTFCVQRIEKAKISAKNQNRRVADGDIKTACEQACPTGAIVFGDLNQDSVVRDRQMLPRAYSMLREFNTRPRNLYLARIGNPNPALDGKKS